MTRQVKKKHVGLTMVTALFLAMALGLSEMVYEDQAGLLVYEFGEFLEGVDAEIQSLPNDVSPSADTTNTMQTEIILSQIAHFKAFDEVIRSQII